MPAPDLSPAPTAEPAPAQHRPLTTNPRLRVLAIVVAPFLLVPVLVGLLVTLVGVAQTNGAPNPFVGDEFICCGHPDTWGDVALGLVLTSAAAALTFAVAMSAVLMLGNFRLPWRLFAVGPVAAAAVAVAAIGFGIVRDLDGLRTPPDCDTFVLDRQLLRQDWIDRAHEEQVLGVAACDAFDGRTPKQVDALLGHAKSLHSDSEDATLPSMTHGPLTIRFEHGQAVSAEIDSPGSGFD